MRSFISGVAEIPKSESVPQPASVDEKVAKHSGFIVQLVALGTDERQIILLSRSFSGFMNGGSQWPSGWPS